MNIAIAQSNDAFLFSSFSLKKYCRYRYVTEEGVVYYILKEGNLQTFNKSLSGNL